MVCAIIKCKRCVGMRRFQKRQILDVFQSLHALHGQIRDKLGGAGYEAVRTALADCQEAAIQVGEAIERIEGEGTDAVTCLEQYCEGVYQVSTQEQAIAGQKAYKILENSLIKAENAVKHFPERREAVFLPYKVSMWDSLESVWMAADQDPNCDAYVIPIPYYDKNPDGSFGAAHYEGDRYPAYVPVVNYQEYDFEERRPDMIFFHNPYDQFNNVTSVHPFFYSKNLRQFTDMLVYIPYYCTAGGMMEGQGYGLAYYYADYLVVQAESYIRFFDPGLPKKKFLPFGSPKFDKVIRLCKNPPELPEAWREKMYLADGTKKKVYFYNTSISGMLADTEQFLRKMGYIFQCFAEYPNACLLWRPHPLLESTFDSMRPAYKPIYEKFKQYFFSAQIGIYDDTPEIETTIAQCDVYVGDAGTSVTSLFGVAGKPVYILNNRIDSKPEQDDWRGEIVGGVPHPMYGDRRWRVTQGNRLYCAPEDDFRYRYYCDLPARASDGSYSHVVSIGDKAYVCPSCAQKILLAADGGIQKVIALERHEECKWSFRGGIACGRYLFLIPCDYPAFVRYDTEKGRIVYLREHLDIPGVETEQGWRFGGYCVYDGCLYIASPDADRILRIEAETGRMDVLQTGAEKLRGCCSLLLHHGEFWLIPDEGYTIGRWDPHSGTLREYEIAIDGMACVDPVKEEPCERYPFGTPAFCGDEMYLPPYWGNKSVRLCIDTGEAEEWKLPITLPEKPPNGYYGVTAGASFVWTGRDNGGGELGDYFLFSNIDRRLYRMERKSGEWREVTVDFDREELLRHTHGFTEVADHLRYACLEDAFHPLSDLLEGNLAGEAFDAERELAAYREIVANHDGTCGDRVYQYISGKL